MDAHRRPVLFASRAESGLRNPMQVLAGELGRRGVPDLRFATDEPRRADIEALEGVEFASLGTPDPRTSLSVLDDETYRRFASSSRFTSHRAALEVAFHPELELERNRALMSVVDDVRPALMVIESLSWFAVALAVARKIPFVLSVPFLPSHPYSGHVPILNKSAMPWHFPAPNTGLPHPMGVLGQLRNQWFRIRSLVLFLGNEMRGRIGADIRICKELGIPYSARRPDAATTEAVLVLGYSVAELDYPFPQPENLRLVGAMLPPLPEVSGRTELTDWLETGAPVVYIGLGTLARLGRADVDALVRVAERLPGHRVLWNLPAEQHAFLPERLPANLRVESWLLSQLDVLGHPNVAVFLTHAGSNGFHESLYFGKPMVTRPLFGDCHDVAVRGRDRGVSLTVDRPDITDADDIVDKLNRVLSDRSFRLAAERMRGLQLAAGGRERAADLLLGLPALAGLPARYGAEGAGC